MNIISFSIYGNNPKYLDGLKRNLEIIRNHSNSFLPFFSDWQVNIYYDNSVPNNALQSYQKFKNIKLIDMTGSGIPGMFWRFLPRGIFIVRDCDSRLSERDVKVVKRWLKSKKDLHIIKDHPDHLFYKILGGMWGMKNDGFDMEGEIRKYCEGKGYKKDNFMGDMDFLRDVVYPKFSKYYSIGLFKKDFIGRVYSENNKTERPENDRVFNKVKSLIKYLKKLIH